MRSKSLMLVCGLVVALLAVAGGLYAYDTTRNDLIADGVTIGGVDVGGMRAHEARDKLTRDILEPLREPVTASFKGRTFTLTPEEARVGVDIDSSVDHAVDRSRSGGIFARTWRGLTGDGVEAALEVDISFDRSVVNGLVERISERLGRSAVDAKVDFGGGGFEARPAENGRAVLERRLRRDLASALVSTEGDRSVAVRTKTVRPKVTTESLAERYPAIVIVNRNRFQLTLYKNLKPAKTYRIAVGQAGLDTPAGLYNIQNKAENPAWHVPQSDWAGELAGEVIPPDDPRNPIEARWMGIYNGAGIHGTTAVSSLGTAASHGCIRMAIPDVIEVYDQVPVGAPIYIA